MSCSSTTCYTSSSKSSFPSYEGSKIPAFRSRFSKPNIFGCAEDSVTVEDSKSLRQRYVRTAYTFTTPTPTPTTEKSSHNNKKGVLLYSRVKTRVNYLVYKKGDNKVSRSSSSSSKSENNSGRKKGFLVGNNHAYGTVKIMWCGYILNMVRRMVACTTKVDVAAQ